MLRLKHNIFHSIKKMTRKWTRQRRKNLVHWISCGTRSNKHDMSILMWQAIESTSKEQAAHGQDPDLHWSILISNLLGKSLLFIYLVCVKLFFFKIRPREKCITGYIQKMDFVFVLPVLDRRIKKSLKMLEILNSFEY